VFVRYPARRPTTPGRLAGCNQKEIVMPVEHIGTFFPKPNITVKQPSGVESVEFDDGSSHTGLSKVEDFELSADVMQDQHTPASTNQFEAPGPVSVVVEGYGLKGETTSPQVKVVESKPRSKGKGTSSAETK
jgi:hypothetical protein